MVALKLNAAKVEKQLLLAVSYVNVCLDHHFPLLARSIHVGNLMMDALVELIYIGELLKENSDDSSWNNDKGKQASVFQINRGSSKEDKIWNSYLYRVKIVWSDTSKYRLYLARKDLETCRTLIRYKLLPQTLPKENLGLGGSCSKD